MATTLLRQCRGHRTRLVQKNSITGNTDKLHRGHPLSNILILLCLSLFYRDALQIFIFHSTSLGKLTITRDSVNVIFLHYVTC